MTNKVFCVLAALLLSSCSNDWSAGLADKRTSSLSAASTERVDLAGAPSSPISDRAARAFADAPDKGSLVQYPEDPLVRRTGAYTWHAADLSEDHALRSTITGDLNFTAPDGTPINLAYERHIEHPDGNWSWIGRAEGERGESTVITFGEEAAFGTIPQGRDQQPLRLTIADGRAWVVSADPRLLREIRNEATHPTKQDFLVPPKLAASTATALGGMEAMGAEAMATTASGKTVVDVLVGFTDGYSTYRGGASAAITRIHNLVEVTNQAYRNSQVNAEVRLVHALQVSYADATANKTALEELTGFKAPSTRTTPAPAFSALRSARDQYGADVVVLLRRFQDPENDGCGIAWLIGGGRSGIDTSDEFFGYSVVSDGQDAGTDGKTYFCRDETLAHEIGHNMGSQHDADQAKKDDGSVSYGAYSYSFGYRAAAGAGNFYTVMAYGDSGQTRNRVFSNPNVSICGIDANLVCGVANQADNARNLVQTMPIIASFRTTVAQDIGGAVISGDLDGDKKDDIVWHSKDQNEHGYWLMDGSAYAGMRFFGATPGYRILVTGDFNGDGLMDELWTNDARDLWMLTSNGSTFADRFVATHGEGWKIVGVGDLNGDQKDDLIWHNQSQNEHGYWLMDGSAYAGMRFFSAPVGYRILAVGDFNGDGLSDELWTNTERDLRILSSNGSSFSETFVGTHSAGWQVVSVGDVNGDRKDDLIWHNPVENMHGYWLMNGGSYIGMKFFTSTPGYRILATGDYNGDGLMDELWTSDARDLWMLISNGSNFSDHYVASYTTGWSVVGSKVN